MSPFTETQQNPYCPSGPGSSWLRMETANRGGGQLEQGLPCGGLCAGEMDWVAMPVLYLMALSKVVIFVPVLMLYWSSPVLCQRNTHKKTLLASKVSYS